MSSLADATISQWPSAFVSHVCEGRDLAAVVNYCGHSRRLVIRPVRNAYLYLRWQRKYARIVDRIVTTIPRGIGGTHFIARWERRGAYEA